MSRKKDCSCHDGLGMKKACKVSWASLFFLDEWLSLFFVVVVVGSFLSFLNGKMFSLSIIITGGWLHLGLTV